AEFVDDRGSPRTGVWGCVQLVSRKWERTENGGEAANATSICELNMIEENVRLCRELLTMWQTYGRVEASPRRPISVTVIVREVLPALAQMAAQIGVELKSEVSEDDCTLQGDPVQIKRAIQNVIINALQASGE